MSKLRHPRNYVQPVPGRYYTTKLPTGGSFDRADLPDIPPGYSSVQVSVWLDRGETTFAGHVGPGKVVFVINGKGEIFSEFFPRKV